MGADHHLRGLTLADYPEKTASRRHCWRLSNVMGEWVPGARAPILQTSFLLNALELWRPYFPLSYFKLCGAVPSSGVQTRTPLRNGA
jgi:hypothetical protein